MRATMHPIKRTDYIKPLFSHGETLEITGLTADTLLTWHKRGLVPRIGRRKHEGRGFRRRYSTVDVAYLVILKHLVLLR
jgi:DNA-binding transcriptional MerR regulator